MQTILESEAYSFCYDRLFGVGRFIRKSDNAVSLLETGSDCEEIKDNLINLLNTAPDDNDMVKIHDIFDAIAGEYSYE